jgi:hypothetical protein
MSEKRKLSAKDVAADVKSGLSNAQIAAKYQLPENQIDAILMKLVGMGALNEADLSREAKTPLHTAASNTSAEDTLPQDAKPDANPAANSTSLGWDQKVMLSCMFAAPTTGIAFAQGFTKSWFWFIVWIPIFTVAAFFGYNLFLDKYKEKIKYVVIAGIFFTLAIIGGIGNKDSSTSTTSSAQNAGDAERRASLHAAARVSERYKKMESDAHTLSGQGLAKKNPDFFWKIEEKDVKKGNPAYLNGLLKRYPPRCQKPPKGTKEYSEYLSVTGPRFWLERWQQVDKSKISIDDLDVYCVKCLARYNSEFDLRKAGVDPNKEMTTDYKLIVWMVKKNKIPKDVGWFGPDEMHCDGSCDDETWKKTCP